MFKPKSKFSVKSGVLALSAAMLMSLSGAAFGEAGQEGQASSIFLGFITSGPTVTTYLESQNAKEVAQLKEVQDSAAYYLAARSIGKPVSMGAILENVYSRYKAAHPGLSETEILADILSITAAH